MSDKDFAKVNSNGVLTLAIFCICILLATGCDIERRKSDSELGLNPQQAKGRQIYDDHCDRCHAPYSGRGRKGPSLKGVFRNPSLSASGLPANDERVGEIIRDGRAKMTGFGQVLDRQQVADLLAYLHTL
ncbi:MAG: cytochrome c6 [Acidobacteriaceae bacterium]|jgi:mono/diheme cytochrome c family protein